MVLGRKRVTAVIISSLNLVRAFGVLSKNACFGAGCYWGTEKYFNSETFDRSLKLGPIINGAVGFMGPMNAIPNPTYDQVCRGNTGHVEVYNFEFDGNPETYKNLVKQFFSFHDPTTLDRQGNDCGSQYASTIFVYDDKQREIATSIKNELQSYLNSNKITEYEGEQVVTNILSATTFFPAHEEHQAYLNKNPWGYCNHGYRFRKWPGDH